MNQELKDKLICLYIEQELSIKDISIRLSVSDTTIRTWLKKCNVSIRPRWNNGNKKRNYTLIPSPTKNILVDLYIIQQKNPNEIAKYFKVSRGVVERWLKENDIIERKRKDAQNIRRINERSNKNFIPYSKEKLIELYQVDLCSPNDIGRMFGIKSVDVILRLQENNIHIRSATETRKIRKKCYNEFIKECEEIDMKNLRKKQEYQISKKCSHDFKADLTRLYQVERLSAVEIGKIYDVGFNVILEKIKYYKITR